jgi:hypothetical protein
LQKINKRDKYKQIPSMETDLKQNNKRPFSGVARLISIGCRYQVHQRQKLVTMELDQQELPITGMELK